MSELIALDSLPETTHAEVFDDNRPRTVRLKLDAGQSVPAHTHPGTNIVLHLVSGHLELTLDDETFDVRPNQLARFSGEREISPHAVEPSTAVLVFAPAGEGEQ
ncbi:cupin domain-containing protein [Haloferax profundi]|uniref:Cupin n=1 Tax=Haloferax profundi TaxID=1544718 RepID=A0A0W1S4T2_9EURY|nr:cupin domain-containing protein [Haloferax profundi]KTG21056.1 cupin [Haloferax profundi]